MTIKTNIHGLEIELKAKGLNNGERCNKLDAIAFLNYVSVLATEASKYNEQIGANASAKQAREFGDLLYRELRNVGAYK